MEDERLQPRKHFSIEDVAARLDTDEWHAFSRESTDHVPEAIALYLADIDFTCAVADCIAKGYLPRDIMADQVIILLALGLTAQARIAGGKVTPTKGTEPMPRANIPDAFLQAFAGDPE